MRPHSDYVLVGRRAALACDFTTMLDDLRSALHRLDRQPGKPAKNLAKNLVTGPSKAPSGEVDAGSRQENTATHQEIMAPAPAANRIE